MACGAEGPVTIFDFADSPSVGYAEGYQAGRIIEASADMARLVMMFDHLPRGSTYPGRVGAVPRQATAGVITMSESLTWVKSSYSSTGNCVEVAGQPSQVLIRDTKDQSGPVVSICAEAWRRFIGQVKR